MHNPAAAGSATLVHFKDGIAVLRIPMHGSCAIPLDVIKPKATDLLMWSFAGFAGQGLADPVSLVVLGCPSGIRLGGDADITIQTHTRELELKLAAQPVPLTPDEIGILAQAVIVSLTSTNAHRLAALFPLLADGLDACMAQASGPALIQRGRDPGTVIASGLDFVPEALLLRTQDGYACAAVKSLRIRSGVQASLVLTFASSDAFTGLGDAASECAILTGHGRHTTARVTTNAQ